MPTTNSNKTLETYDVKNQDGALVLKNDGDMFILVSNDVRVNLYLLAVQKLLSENKLVQMMVAAEIERMIHETNEEMKNEKESDVPTDTEPTGEAA